jgi:tRNA(Ile)-lysidine synthase TilS/MesJ
MKAHYEINAGDLSVIRPMIYCRESLMTAFAKEHNLPVINENCPACFEEPKERARVKKLLSREETLYPNIYDNIRRSLIPIMHDDSTAILRSYTEEALSKSRREKGNGNGNKKRQKQPNESDNSKPSDACNVNKTESNGLTSNGSVLLGDIPEEDLIKELARRKALKFKLAEAMKKMENSKVDDIDPTGQVCTLDGRGGTIPCRELME